MLVALTMVPSPGSTIGLSSSQMIRPRSSSMTDHSEGKAVMWLPGKLLMVFQIQARTSSRPFHVPAACSMYSTSGAYCSTQGSQSRVSAARATVCSKSAKAAASSLRVKTLLVTSKTRTCSTDVCRGASGSIARDDRGGADGCPQHQTRRACGAGIKQESRGGRRVVAGAVPGDAAQWHRAGVHRRILGQQRTWYLRRCGLRGAVVRVGQQVRQRDGMAELHQADRRRERRREA